MTSVWRFRAIGLAIAAAIYAIDQVIKSLVLGPWRLPDRQVIELLPFFDLRYTRNYGVSLGMFEATSPEMRWALVGLTATIALVVLMWMLRERQAGDIAHQALGNITDRYVFGFVVDYADFHIGTFRPFLVFNVADAAITIGVLIILARALFMREKPAASQADQPVEPTAENS